LLGERGLLPVPDYLVRVGFRRAPSLFHLHYSDRFLRAVAALGIALSLLALLGLSDAGPLWLSISVWLLLWALYLSIVNVGQTFYAFGWESMLLEAGFFAAFLGPAGVAPSLIPVLALRWMLFRVELGAGLIKLRHDPCWRDLTCLYYHHETQPMPNPLSARFHALPRRVLRAGVAFSHLVQIAAPFGLFGPQPVAAIAGGLIIAHQLALIAAGNYAWLNWLTVVLAITAFSDASLRAVAPFDPASLAARPPGFDAALGVLAIVTALLSIQPTLNFFSGRQKMNYNYNPLHWVGSYGAFGSVTRRRYEIVIEGTDAEAISNATQWREYEFKAKPGDVRRRPPQWAPYHLRLDWLLWFVPLSVERVGERLWIPGYERWFVRLIEKLLEADPATLALLRSDPFGGGRPRFVRAGFYRYRFTDRRERRTTGVHWKRTYVGEYLAPRART
jgi:Lipase maturation factor